MLGTAAGRRVWASLDSPLQDIMSPAKLPLPHFTWIGLWPSCWLLSFLPLFIRKLLRPKDAPSHSVFFLQSLQFRNFLFHLPLKMVSLPNTPYMVCRLAMVSLKYGFVLHYFCLQYLKDCTFEAIRGVSAGLQQHLHAGENWGNSGLKDSSKHLCKKSKACPCPPKNTYKYIVDRPLAMAIYPGFVSFQP